LDARQHTFSYNRKGYRMKVKDIKKIINLFDDDSNVLIECCIKDCDDNRLIDKEYDGTYFTEIMYGEPFQIELCNFGLIDDESVEFMFSTHEYIEKETE
jgi:hypothetical protein